MNLLASIGSSIGKWIIEKVVHFAIEWVKKLKRVKEISDQVDSEVRSVQSIVDEINAFRQIGKPVPKELEDELKVSLARLNSSL